jgi:hypothetical protein
LTQAYIRKVVEDVGLDEDFSHGPWLSAVNFMNANGGVVYGCLGDIKSFISNGKVDQVVAIIQSCTPKAIGDLSVILKDLSGSIPGAIHHKIINEEGIYRKAITVGTTVVVHNVSVFSPNRSHHSLNITKKNLVKVFPNDTLYRNGSGVAVGGMLNEEEIIELLEEEERAEQEWRNGGISY